VPHHGILLVTGANATGLKWTETMSQNKSLFLVSYLRDFVRAMERLAMQSLFIKK
jgi:hypothetical protein